MLSALSLHSLASLLGWPLMRFVAEEDGTPKESVMARNQPGST
jgi:hypothetical protein